MKEILTRIIYDIENAKTDKDCQNCVIALLRFYHEMEDLTKKAGKLCDQYHNYYSPWFTKKMSNEELKQEVLIGLKELRDQLK